MSALMRLHTAEAFKHLPVLKQNEISAKVSDAVNFLRKAEKLDKKDIENFSTTSDDILETMKAVSEDILRFTKDGSSNDDQFALFTTAIDDFSAYIAMYVAIRTSDWHLRIAAIKMMAQRFVRSGAMLYKWLSTRHLADLATTYPEEVLRQMRCGGWVSALKDGRGVTLARDEYHERTASHEIKCVMPQQLTKQNMEVITQYSTYGARVRNNFLNEFFSIKSSSFEVAKGCSRKWLANQEHLISIFLNMLKLESPFKSEGRSLYQPYTNIPAKPSLKKDFLGRENLEDIPQDHGKEVLESYVSSYSSYFG